MPVIPSKATKYLLKDKYKIKKSYEIKWLFQQGQERNVK